MGGGEVFEECVPMGGLGFVAVGEGGHDLYAGDVRVAGQKQRTKTIAEAAFVMAWSSDNSNSYHIVESDDVTVG